MKMKKIISLCVCAMMALSTVANAAYTLDEDGWYNADKVTAAEVTTRQPKADIKVTELTAAEAKTAGLALGKGASALTDANSDFYKIDLTVSNLGDLMYAYLNGSDYANEMQVRLYEAQIVLNNVVYKKIYTASEYNGIKWQTSDAGNEDNMLSMYWNAGSVDACIPTRNPASGDLVGAYVENAALDTATFVFAVADGVKYENITPVIKVTYNVINDAESEEPKAMGKTLDGKTVSIAPAAAEAKLDKVVISGATATTLTVGDEVTLTAKAYNDDETEKAAAIAWTVEGDAVTVADGLVKAVKEGTATVTATAVDGEITKSASVTFTVEAEKLPALPEVTVAGGDVAGQEVKSGENTIGYLWKAIFNAATIKDKYIATFKSGAETNAATLKGFAAHNIEGEGNVSVIVALNTAKAAVTLGITE